ncbi:MAG: hypothetical protein FD143_3209 [Ignavibacteria bacterium]|nr:MAG: hypothetical protein FD143_3209 [Ignavibacteria bacterium]KAF0153943.1 MAG: hypothetical protein FD188_3322 [Ignavibacteria bacterium]
MKPLKKIAISMAFIGMMAVNFLIILPIESNASTASCDRFYSAYFGECFSALQGTCCPDVIVTP